MVSEPPRPRKVTSWSVDTPWAPPTTGTWPVSTASRSRSGRTSTILAFVWLVSVMKPAWLPVKLSAGTPTVVQRHAQQGHGLALAGGDEHVHLAPGPDVGDVAGQAEQLVGLLAHGADHHDDVAAVAPVRATWSATSRMRSGSATDVPPYFWMTNATADNATGGWARRTNPLSGVVIVSPSSSPAVARPLKATVREDGSRLSAPQDRVDGLSTRAPQAWSLLIASATSVCRSAQIARRSSRRMVSTRPL